MDKQLLEMFEMIMKKMTEMQSDVKSVKLDMAEMKSEASDLRTEMNARFDAVDMRFGAVDDRMTRGFAETVTLFNSADKRFNTLEELTGKIATQDVEFLKHKMVKIEQDVFVINKNQ